MAGENEGQGPNGMEGASAPQEPRRVKIDIGIDYAKGMVHVTVQRGLALPEVVGIPIAAWMQTAAEVMGQVFPMPGKMQQGSGGRILRPR